MASEATGLLLRELEAQIAYQKRRADGAEFHYFQVKEQLRLETLRANAAESEILRLKKDIADEKAKSPMSKGGALTD
ncbi:MAG: hypothetical protein Hyperionvirus6_52 [Hyperionvirus sp.]|uniref:Uncharacterized protein n=1 Tax=Hyperionvirus sp. TaxID=2487770 RepID=A0A3G5AAV8_9VIRU|nr:MAG: hypothetical protein Hyperionvirus6_52 [Hyperionvirus sp.]